MATKEQILVEAIAQEKGIKELNDKLEKLEEYAQKGAKGKLTPELRLDFEKELKEVGKLSKALSFELPKAFQQATESANVMSRAGKIAMSGLATDVVKASDKAKGALVNMDKAFDKFKKDADSRMVTNLIDKRAANNAIETINKTKAQLNSLGEVQTKTMDKQIKKVKELNATANKVPMSDYKESMANFYKVQENLEKVITKAKETDKVLTKATEPKKFRIENPRALDQAAKAAKAAEDAFDALSNSKISFNIRNLSSLEKASAEIDKLKAGQTLNMHITPSSLAGLDKFAAKLKEVEKDGRRVNVNMQVNGEEQVERVAKELEGIAGTKDVRIRVTNLNKSITDLNAVGTNVISRMSNSINNLTKSSVSLTRSLFGGLAASFTGTISGALTGLKTKAKDFLAESVRQTADIQAGMMQVRAQILGKYHEDPNKAQAVATSTSNDLMDYQRVSTQSNTALSHSLSYLLQNFDPKQSEKLLVALDNIASAGGGDLIGITRAVSQSLGMGALKGQEINQLVNSGGNTLINEIAKGLEGTQQFKDLKAAGEVQSGNDLLQLKRSNPQKYGTIDTTLLTDAIKTLGGASQDFRKAVEQGVDKNAVFGTGRVNSANTLKGTWQNMQEDIFQTMANAFGFDINTGLFKKHSIMDAISNEMRFAGQSIAQFFKDHQKEVDAWSVKVGTKLEQFFDKLNKMDWGKLLNQAKGYFDKTKDWITDVTKDFDLSGMIKSFKQYSDIMLPLMKTMLTFGGKHAGAITTFALIANVAGKAYAPINALATGITTFAGAFKELRKIKPSDGNIFGKLFGGKAATGGAQAIESSIAEAESIATKGASGFGRVQKGFDRLAGNVVKASAAGVVAAGSLWLMSEAMKKINQNMSGIGWKEGFNNISKAIAFSTEIEGALMIKGAVGSAFGGFGLLAIAVGTLQDGLATLDMMVLNKMADQLKILINTDLPDKSLVERKLRQLTDLSDLTANQLAGGHAFKWLTDLAEGIVVGINTWRNSQLDKSLDTYVGLADGLTKLAGSKNIDQKKITDAVNQITGGVKGALTAINQFYNDKQLQELVGNVTHGDTSKNLHTDDITEMTKAIKAIDGYVTELGQFETALSGVDKAAASLAKYKDKLASDFTTIQSTMDVVNQGIFGNPSSATFDLPNMGDSGAKFIGPKAPTNNIKTGKGVAVNKSIDNITRSLSEGLNKNQGRFGDDKNPINHDGDTYMKTFTKAINNYLTELSQLKDAVDKIVQASNQLKKLNGDKDGIKAAFKNIEDVMNTINKGIFGGKGGIHDTTDKMAEGLGYSGADVKRDKDNKAVSPMTENLKNIESYLAELKIFITKIQEFTAQAEVVKGLVGGGKGKDGKATASPIKEMMDDLNKLSGYIADGISGATKKLNNTKTSKDSVGEIIQAVQDIPNRIKASEGAFQQAGNNLGGHVAKGFDIQVRADSRFKSAVDSQVQSLSKDKVAAFESVGGDMGKALVRGFQSEASKLAETISAQMSQVRASIDSVSNAADKVKAKSPVKKAAGGLISPVGTDTVPALLTAGEHVTRKAAVDFWGDSLLTKINNLDIKGAYQALAAKAGIGGFGGIGGGSSHTSYDNSSRHTVVNVTNRNHGSMGRAEMRRILGGSM